MPPGSSSNSLPFNKSYVFVIGIDRYEFVEPLKTAVADAKAVSQVLEEKHAYEIHTSLLDETATKANILDLIQEIIPNLLEEKDRAIFYFAGHGIAYDSEGDPQGFLVPVDGRLEETATLISMNELNAAMDTWLGQHGLLILDCCFAGAFRWSLSTRAGRRRAPRIVYEQRFMRYAQDKAWQVLASAGADQEAIDLLHRLIGARATEGHSPFATALLEGLQGLADFGVIEGKQDGLVTAAELYVYLRDRVNQMTSNSSIRQTPALFNLSRHDKGEFLFLNPNSPLNLPPFPERNPYVGLRSYSAEDRLYYHGRDKVLDRLLQKCLAEPLVVVTGGSGVGKSSLLAAGLVPRLEEMGWEVLPVFTPGRDPLSKLESEMPDWKDQLGSGNKVWIIDQYEECLAAGLSSPLWQDFERELAAVIENEVSMRKDGKLASLLIVLAIRSDYELLLQTQVHPLNPAEGQWWKEGRFLVPYFSREDLLEVIIQPADQAVLFFEPASFPFTLANELDGLPGALPLLSLSLSALYDKFVASNRKDRTLLASEYWSMGGIAGILSNRADSVMEQLADLQPIVRKILVRMIQVENGQLTGRRVAHLPAGLSTNDNRKLVDELDYPGDDNKQAVEKVVQTLIHEQLIILTSDQQGQSYLEPVHDALILYWPKCRQWIEEKGIGSLIVHRNLWEVVKEFSTTMPSSIRERRPTTVPTPTLLWDNNPHLSNLHGELSNNNHSFNQLEKDFLERSMEQRQNEIQRLERLNEQITQQRDEAIRQKEEAERRGREVQSLAYAQVASTEIGKDNGLAYYLAHASYQAIQPEKPSIITTRTLLQLAYHHLPFWPVQNLEGGVSWMASSSSLDLFLVQGFDNYLRIYDQDLQLIATSPETYVLIEAAAVDPLDRYVFIKSRHIDEIWDFRNDQRQELEPTVVASWSPDGTYCLLMAPEGITRFMQIAEALNDWQEVWQKDGIINASISRENQVFCQRAGNEGVQLLSATDHTLIKAWERGRLGQFSPDGSQFMLIDEKEIYLISAQDGKELLRQIIGEEDEIEEVGFSPDGELIFTHSTNAIIKLWKLDDGPELELLLEVAESYHPSFSPNSRFFLTNRLDATQVWDRHALGSVFWEDKLDVDQNSTASFSLNGMQIWMHRMISHMMAESRLMLLPQFSPDGRYLLLNNVPLRCKVVDLYAGVSIDFPHYDISTFSFFSPDSRHVYLESNGRKLEKWALHTAFRKNVGRRRVRFQQLEWIPGESLLQGVHSDHVIGFYGVDGFPLVEELLPPEAKWFVRFSPDGRFVAARSWTSAMMWQRTGEQLKPLDLPLGKVTDVLFSEDSNLMLVTGENRKGTLWRWEKDQWVKGPDSFRDLKEARFTPTGEMLYSIVSQAVVQLWNLDGILLDELRFLGEKGAEHFDFHMTSNSIREYHLIEFFNDDQFAVTKSNYGSLRFWKLNKSYQKTDNAPDRLQQVETQLLEVAIQEPFYTKFTLSADRRNLLLYSANGGQFQRMSLDIFYEEEEISTIQFPGFLSYKNMKALYGFSPLGEFQFELYENFELRLEHIKDQVETFINVYPNRDPTSIFDQTDMVFEEPLWYEYSSRHWLEISPDGKYMFVQLGGNQGAGLLDFKGNKLIDIEEKGSSITKATFSADGQHLLTLSGNGLATIYSLPEKIFETLSTPNYLSTLSPRQKQKAGLSSTSPGD
ncbi:MAG: caspase family protein [Saprospiraceae bacterium]|nr:caspase family protein [Saprospiraceae bacterium]